MADIFNRLLVSSDPLISSFTSYRPKPGKPISSEALQMLECPPPSSFESIFKVADEDDVDAEDEDEDEEDDV